MRPFTRAAWLALMFLPFLAAAPLSAQGAHSYLVLPFEDSAPDPSRDWLEEAMAISLSDFLLGAGQEVVDREERLLGMDELELPVGAPLTLATSLKLGRHFRTRGDSNGPDRLIVGKFSLVEGQLTLSARVLRLDANAAAPWREESGSLKDLLKLQKSLAHDLLRSDGSSTANLAAHADDANSGHAFPLLAYENYIRGMIDPSVGKQIGYLRKAVELSPGYPKATFQLARLLSRSGKKDDAESVLKGIAGDPAPYAADYHAFKGGLALDAGRLSEAQEEASRSISLRETAAGHVLLARIARAQSDPARALQELDKAEALDPDNADIDPLRKQLGKEASPRS
jgi:hypothetical protein